MADELDDLELDLLEVAGRGSKRRKDSGDDSDDIFGSDSDDEPRRRGPAKKLAGGGKVRREDSESEDDDEDNDEGGYGSDLYIDDEDRRKLEAMTELDREMILADRAEEKDKQRQRRALLKKKKSVDADRFEPRQGNRLSSRHKRTASDKDSAIKRIEAARSRQEKGKKATKGKAKGRQMDGSDSDFEDRDSEEDDFRPSDEEEEEEEASERSEEEEEDERDQDVGRRDMGEGERGADRFDARPQRYDDLGSDEEAEEDATFEEVKTIQVLRSQLEGWYDKPIFTGDGLYGCMVRVAYGHANNKGGPSYMLMQIRDVKESGRPYVFGPKGAPCNKYLVLMDGLGLSHIMAMQNVSNQELEQPEFLQYLRHVERGQKLQNLKRQDIEMARSKITALQDYRWDSSNVKEAIERKRAQGILPVNIAAEKARLRRLLDDAKGGGRADEAATLEQQLRDLEARAMADKRTDKRTFGMSHINKRNQQLNFLQTIKNVSNVPYGGSKNESKSGVDVFSRRLTRPGIYWNTKGKDASEEAAATEAGDDATANAGDAFSPRGGPQMLPGGVASTRLGPHLLKLDPLELIKLLDFDVKVDQLQEGSSTPSLSKRLLGPKWHHSLSRHTSESMDLANKTVMTIADWKRRAGYM